MRRRKRRKWDKKSNNKFVCLSLVQSVKLVDEPINMIGIEHEPNKANRIS